jgi:hypothetical protein
MPARQKLNGVALYICLAVGAFAALISGSAAIFWVATGLLVMVAVHTGSIRPKGGNRN